MNNKLYFLFKDIIGFLANGEYHRANVDLCNMSKSFEGDKELYPYVRNALYDLAFLHKDFVENKEKADAHLKDKTHRVMTELKNVCKELIH